MIKYLTIILMFLFAGSLSANENILNDFEKKIIVLALETTSIDHNEKGEKNIIVRPQTFFFYNDISRWNKRKEYIKEGIKIKGYDLTNILDELFNKNKKPYQLDLQSEPSNGYIIDYENKFGEYLDIFEQRWDKLLKENPNVFGVTRVSRPAYDKDRGIVLIYIDIQCGGLCGYGIIFAYNYNGKELKQLGSVGLWTS